MYIYMADDPISDDEEKPITTAGGTNCFSSDVVSSSGKLHNSNLQTDPMLQSFEPTSSPEIHNFNSRRSTMIGFDQQSPNKIHLHQGLSFFDKPEDDNINNNPSYSKGVNDQFYLQQHEFGTGNTFLGDPSSSLRCVFPCEANETPGQGLSLSLNSSNPSTIGLQSFELRRRPHDEDLDLMRLFGPSSSSNSRSANDLQQQQSPPELQIIRNSKYLGPAKEFLNELCSLGTNKESAGKMKAHNEYWESDERSLKNQELYSLDPVELQRRKTKLIHMLEEVDTRYKHYCNHMRAMVSSFEAVAGEGSATVYSGLASKAMSRHFRCLRDGIVSQIKATNKVIGSEPSRSRLGYQKPLQQQMSMMETHHHYPWRRRRGLPEKPVSILRAWLFEHFLHPYPNDVDKQMLALKTGLTRSQVSNWYINARVRLWKPMIEEMYLDELKEQEAIHNNNNVALPSSSNPNLDLIHDHQNQSPRIGDDQKPTHDIFQTDHSKLFRPTLEMQQLEFSPYRGGISGGPGGEVSLTLELHNQNVITSGGGGGGGGHERLLPLSSSSQSSIFYNPRLLYEDNHGQNLPYSLVGDSGDHGQTLPLGDLIGRQLLHDLDE